MSFTVEQESFTGPLGVLLELIEAQKLEITALSLAKVAEAYLLYLDTHQVASADLAEFLVVASRLIYLKSRELLPYLRLDEEEQGVNKLQDQLRLYQEYAVAASTLEKRYLRHRMFARPVTKTRSSLPAIFVLPDNVTLEALSAVYLMLVKRLQPFLALHEASLERIQSVEERLEELALTLRAQARLSFQELVQGAQSKMSVVVSFLALLELLRRRQVRVEQVGIFTDIHLQRVS